MHSAPSLLRRFSRDSKGSAVVGFVLVTPLVIFAFLAVFELAMLGSTYIGLTTAVSQGARQAAILGESDYQAKKRVIELGNVHSLAISAEQITIRHFRQNSMAVIQVSARVEKRISFLNRVIALQSSALAIDEDEYK